MKAYRSFKLDKAYTSLKERSKHNKLGYIYNYQYDCMFTYEDAKKILEINENLLSYNGFTNVITAENGFDANEMIRNESVDLVVLDIIVSLKV